jgi:hypothetical protein
MQALVTRTEQHIGAITEAIVSSAEVAAERIVLAAQVARVQQRMAAFSAVLEAIGVQKAALLDRLATATGPTKALVATQVSLLEAQEVEVLKKVGVPEAAARQALVAVGTASDEPGGTHVREGRRFRRVETTSGTGRNGTHRGGTDED